MGDANQYLYIERYKDRLSGPYLEIGSRDYGSTRNLRSFFPGEHYTGVDLSDGKSVDIVVDLTQPFEKLDAVFNQQRFGTIFSFSVMEHCDNPFLMAENMTRLLKPGGRVVISVPFAWQFHGYPSDYWRFTAEGVKKLFPELVWEQQTECWHTPKEGDFRQLDESVGQLSLSGKHHRNNGNYLRGFSADCLKLLRTFGLLRWLTGYRYLMTPTMINMVGVLPEQH